MLPGKSTAGSKPDSPGLVMGGALNEDGWCLDRGGWSLDRDGRGLDGDGWSLDGMGGAWLRMGGVLHLPSVIGIGVTGGQSRHVRRGVIEGEAMTFGLET